ncbi:hypothetical protein C8R43DRAFT_44645 [Mycena crocata]|nr:hypothetical protein C8R43DRAFT_44645 [Mycena crocata]
MSVCAADRTRLAHLEARILELEHEIVSLQIQKAETESRLDSYRYPVLTLPNEIISEIFIHFLPPYPLCPPASGTLSPTVLSHVCRDWRQIAVATPELWRAISLTFRSANNPDGKIDLLKSWLARSCTIPLSIDLDDQAYEAPVAECIQTLIPHRARWESLRFFALPLRDLPCLAHPLPLLSHIAISCQERAPLAVTFGNAPRLRSAILDNHGVSAVILPWAQLTSLTLTRVWGQECSPILQHATSLVHCVVAVIPFFGDDEYPDVTLPHLESLVLAPYIADSSPVTHFLDCFIAPALHTLQIPDAFLGDDPIEKLASFITKAGCKLQSLSITGDRSIPDEAYRTAFPSIAKLTFNRVSAFRGSSNFEGETDDEAGEAELE